MDIQAHAAKLLETAKTIEAARLVEQDLGWWAKAIAERAKRGATKCTDEVRFFYQHFRRSKNAEYMRILSEYLGPGFTVAKRRTAVSDGITYHEYDVVDVSWKATR